MILRFWPALLVLITCTACEAQPPAEPRAANEPWPTSRPAAAVVRCNVPTPRSWDQKGVMEAYRTAAQISECICLPDPVQWWAAQGQTFADSKVGKESQWQKALIQEAKTTVFIQLDPYPPPRTGKLAAKLPRELAGKTFAAPELRAAFIADAVARVKAYDADYVGLAMEINAYYEQQPEDFDNFVSLFAEARQAIKAVRPEALVFVSFQYEQLLGRFGGMAGMTVHEPHWELLAKFEPHTDAVGLSSYPWESFSPLRYGDPAKLPDNYYTRIAEHTKKPLVFAELGWSSDPKYGGSEASQARFLQRFAELTRGLDVRLVNYFFLYDNDAFGPAFSAMGLYDKQGKPKEAAGVWRRLWTEP